MTYEQMMEVVKKLAENRLRYGKDKENVDLIVEDYLSYLQERGLYRFEPVEGKYMPLTEGAKRGPVYQIIDKGLKIVTQKEMPYEAETPEGRVRLTSSSAGVYCIEVQMRDGTGCRMVYDRKPTKTQVRQDTLLGLYEYRNSMFFSLRDVVDGRWYVK